MSKPKARSAWPERGNGGAELFAPTRSDEDENGVPRDDAADEDAPEDYDLTEDNDLGIDEGDLEVDDDDDDDEDDDQNEDEGEA